MFRTLLTWLLRFFINTAITVASLAVSLLLAELFVRTYMPSPDYGGGKRPALYSNLFEHDELLGWKGVPNVRSPYFSKDFKVTISHDAFGYRNIYPPYATDKKNYLLVGDSFGWGWGVEDDETAAAVFNRNNPDTNLYSLSIPGYGTDQEYLALQTFLAKHPDHKYQGVVLVFYYNDFENNVTTVSHRYPKPVFLLDEKQALSLHNVPVPNARVPQDAVINVEPYQENLLSRSQLFNFFTYNIFRLLIKQDPVEAKKEFDTANTVSDWEKGSQILTAAIIADMKKYCTERDMDFHVIFLMTQNTDLHPAILISGLTQKLTEQNTDYSFLYSRKFPRTDLWLDTHYTPYGQAFLADHITDIIAGKTSPATQ